MDEMADAEMYSLLPIYPQEHLPPVQRSYEATAPGEILAGGQVCELQKYW